MAMHSINRFRLSTGRLYESTLEFNNGACRRMITLDGRYSTALSAIGSNKNISLRMGTLAKSFIVGAISMSAK